MQYSRNLRTINEINLIESFLMSDRHTYIVFYSVDDLYKNDSSQEIKEGF